MVENQKKPGMFVMWSGSIKQNVYALNGSDMYTPCDFDVSRDGWGGML